MVSLESDALLVHESYLLVHFSVMGKLHLLDAKHKSCNIVLRCLTSLERTSNVCLSLILN